MHQIHECALTRVRFRTAVNMGGPVVDEVNTERTEQGAFGLKLCEVWPGLAMVSVTKGQVTRLVPLDNVLEMAPVTIEQRQAEAIPQQQEQQQQKKKRT